MSNLGNLTPWKPGQSGNLNGRSVGTRTVFSQAFLKDLDEVWSDEGREAMVKTARDNPAVFFATCARLIPSDNGPTPAAARRLCGAQVNQGGSPRRQQSIPAGCA